MSRSAWSILVAALLLPMPAGAEPLLTAGGAAARAETHVLLQATAGFSCDATMGLGYGALVGVGGRLGALPPRLYFVVEGARATHDLERTSAAGTITSRFTGNDLAGGLRLLMPVSGPLQLYADVLAGATYGELGLTSPTEPARAARRWSPLVDVAAGVDFRLHRNLSAGLRAKFHLMDPTPAWMAGRGGSAARTAELAATLAVHF